jgi:hypothetical protein
LLFDFPLLESIHVLGLLLIVGTVVVIDLFSQRLLPDKAHAARSRWCERAAVSADGQAQRRSVGSLANRAANRPGGRSDGRWRSLSARSSQDG